MKLQKPKWVYFLAIGLLSISLPLLLKQFISVNDDAGDFLIGFGAVFVIASLFIARNTKSPGDASADQDAGR